MLFFKGLDHVKESETYSLTAKRKGRKKTHTQRHTNTQSIDGFLILLLQRQKSD
jgi:hypothetical protein